MNVFVDLSVWNLSVHFILYLYTYYSHRRTLCWSIHQSLYTDVNESCADSPYSLVGQNTLNTYLCNWVIVWNEDIQLPWIECHTKVIGAWSFVNSESSVWNLIQPCILWPIHISKRTLVHDGRCEECCFYSDQFTLITFDGYVFHVCFW